ncbi:hypothetical protein [Haladaptatus sp. ZSTT2]|uniref:hypothetical protein n=1 Tax=Haladaptatus sp. ZSTT2 TaxID=3120515 RepID=UPI00300F5C80
MTDDDIPADAVEFGLLPTLGRPFLALTDEHEQRLEAMTNAIKIFAAEEGQGGYPLYMVYGPYRVGKSQFLYETYNHAWEKGVPAVFIAHPGQMLDQFDADEEDSLPIWLEKEGQIQLEAMVRRDFDTLSWVPDVPQKELEAWLNENVPTEVSVVDMDRWVLIIDEVEQHFQRLRKAVGVEDENSLRVINDSLTDVLCFWSFGQLSAYEFQVQGDADRGRQVDIEIPPVTVEDVRNLLRKASHDESLASFIWWASRGRPAWVHKLITELDGDEANAPTEWLERLAQDPIAEVDLVRPVWTENVEAYDASIRSVAFLPNGYPDWVIADDTAIPAKRMVTLLHERLQDLEPLASSNPEAHVKIQVCLRRAVHALADSNGHLPYSWLHDQEEAIAFLEIAQNILASFEPHSKERTIVFETLEVAKSKLSSAYVSALHKLDEDDIIETDVEVTAPRIVTNAFPPLALNPRRLTTTDTDSLYESMGRGLRVESHNRVTVVFCPTKAVFETELDILRNEPDLASPNVLFVPEEVDVTLDGVPKALSDFDVLSVRHQDAARLWDFVVHLQDYATQKGQNSGTLDDKAISALIEAESDHEIATTLRSLYEQLADRVGKEAAEGLWTDYHSRFAGPAGNQLIWEQDAITTAEWTNAPLHEQRFMTAFLFAFGVLPDTTQEYSTIPKTIEDAKTEFDEFSTSNFLHTELVGNGFKNSGDLSKALSRLHGLHYRADGSIAPPVQNVLKFMAAVADAYADSTEALFVKVDDDNARAGKGEIPIIRSASVESTEEFSWLRAALAATLVRDTSFVKEKLSAIATSLETDRKTVEKQIQRIDELSADLSPPDGIEVGTGVELTPAYLNRIEENLRQMHAAVENAAMQCDVNPDFRVSAYGYLIFARRYATVMGEAVDKLPSALIKDGDFTDIRGLREAYSDLDKAARSFADVSEYTDTQADLIEDVEELGKSVLDFEGTAGTDRIAIPDDTGVIPALTDKARSDRRIVQNYLDDLENLMTEHHAKAEQKADLKNGLDAFIARVTTPEVEQ